MGRRDDCFFFPFFFPGTSDQPQPGADCILHAVSSDDRGRRVPVQWVGLLLRRCRSPAYSLAARAVVVTMPFPHRMSSRAEVHPSKEEGDLTTLNSDNGVKALGQGDGFPDDEMDSRSSPGDDGVDLQMV